MEQRDYLMKQIDLLGVVLATIMAKLLGIKQGQENIILEEVKQNLIADLQIDFDNITSISDDDFINLLNEKKIGNDNIEQFANILLLMTEELSRNDIDNKYKKMYTKCLAIYRYLNKSESTYSFERHSKIEKIEKKL